MRRALLMLALGTRLASAETSDLSYESIDSDKRIKCLYGYAAEKTGDHASARKIFEDCIERWSDVIDDLACPDVRIGLRRAR